MSNKVEIFKSPENQVELSVQFENETVWLSQRLMAELFDKDSDTIGLHIKNIYAEAELEESSTTEFFSVVQKEGGRKVKRKVKYYNLDIIISVGYRVNSKRGTQFRQWATQRLKDYLVQGYAINEKRLQQKQQEVEYLKTGIRILNRAIEEKLEETDSEMLQFFANGLLLLDDYDHELLDNKGLTETEAEYPEYKDYMTLITEMYSDFESNVFAKPKDESFHSSINQIKQSFGGIELYPSLEEKAANLLYLIVKNHSFVDGNKRIGAACFLYFLKQNELLINKNGNPIISNEALAALTLFVATSKTEEKDSVTRLIISILNRNKA
ncbi:MAG: virulence protein RhuM/Fic/DOC family protein [Bacteroidota bacterium]|nr:virulence protein RhuM/Fic/DOC family protein [Bacteroidota bacterium]